VAAKIYFVIITLVIVFSHYYQFITTAKYTFFDYLILVRDVILVFGGFSYFFKKNLLSPSTWKYLYWYLLAHLILSVVQQILPSSYYGNLEDGQIFLNIFVFILVMSFYIPLYFAVYILQIHIGTSHKHKGRNKLTKTSY
jgi:hypothetical protein